MQPEAIARTVDAVTDLAAAAARLQPATIQVRATSAAREAVNCGELVHAIERAVGLSVEIISGDQEADYVFGSVAAGRQTPRSDVDLAVHVSGPADGLAVRVPLLNASLTDCVFEVSRPTTVEEVNALLKAGSEGALLGAAAVR